MLHTLCCLCFLATAQCTWASFAANFLPAQSLKQHDGRTAHRRGSVCAAYVTACVALFRCGCGAVQITFRNMPTSRRPRVSIAFIVCCSVPCFHHDGLRNAGRLSALTCCVCFACGVIVYKPSPREYARAASSKQGTVPFGQRFVAPACLASLPAWALASGA